MSKKHGKSLHDYIPLRWISNFESCNLKIDNYSMRLLRHFHLFYRPYFIYSLLEIVSRAVI